MARIKDFADHLLGKTATYEGGVGYKTDLRETIAEFFSLGLLNGTFYQTQEEVMANAAELFQKALAECPEFASKAAVYGRTKNSLKLAPALWLAYLSTLEDKSLFNKCLPKIADNLGVLHNFMEICRKTPIRKGLGRSVKRAVNTQLIKLLNDYSVSRNKTLISELVKVSRPNYTDQRFQNYMRYVSRGEASFERASELKRVLEKIKNNQIDEDTLSAIEKFSFQLEELKHSVNNFPAADKERLRSLSKSLINEKDMEKIEGLQKEILELKKKEAGILDSEGKKALYAALYKGLRYTALILNLVALERVFAVETKLTQKRISRGVFTQEEVLKTDIPLEIERMIVEKIRDTVSYRKSNILPFALINAERMVTNTAFKSALADVLNACAAETFSLPPDAEILAGVDVSGSMSVSISDRLSAIDIAAVFAALLKLCAPKTTVCAISNDCTPVSFKGETLFDMARDICEKPYGGTYLANIMKKYAGQKYLILITDSETADDFEAAWLKAEKPAGAKLIVWQVQAYAIHLSKHPSVVYLAGFSDRILSLIKSVIEDTGDQLGEIEKVEL